MDLRGGSGCKSGSKLPHSKGERDEQEESDGGGGGFVGSTLAQRIVDFELADVVLTDILEGPPQGKALDMMQAAKITGTSAYIRGFRRRTAITARRREATWW